MKKIHWLFWKKRHTKAKGRSDYDMYLFNKMMLERSPIMWDNKNKIWFCLSAEMGYDFKYQKEVPVLSCYVCENKDFSNNKVYNFYVGGNDFKKEINRISNHIKILKLEWQQT